MVAARKINNADPDDCLRHVRAVTASIHPNRAAD
jgi:hypothetical protein